MQKVISGDQFLDMVTNDTTQVTGFVAKADDVSDLVSVPDMVNGLRLDYDDSWANGAVEAARLKFDAPEGLSIPYKQGKMGGAIADQGYPWTGNGFLANLDGHARPESVVPSGGVDIATRNPVLEAVDANGDVLYEYRWDGIEWVEQ